MTIVDGVRLVSNSEVQTFKDCPRRWWLAWHRGLTPKRESPVGAAPTGMRYHAALAELYVPAGQTPGDPLVKLDELHSEALVAFGQLAVEAVDDWTGETTKLINDEQQKKLTSSFDLERAMVEGYLQWLEKTGADAQLEIIAPEEYVEVEFTTHLEGYAPNHVKLIGKLDARARNVVTGGIRFIDHKTVASLFDPLLRLNQQMLHYHVIEQEALPDGQPRCEGALYNMARKVKRTRASTPPYFGRTLIDHNGWELANYKKQLAGVVDQMVRTEQDLAGGAAHQYAVPSRPSRDCSWKCPFLKICHMFDDGSRVEDAIAGLYQVRDPLEYYAGKEKGSDS